MQDGPFSSTQRESSGVVSKILTAVLTARNLFQTLDNVVFLDFCLSSTRKKESIKRRTGSQRAWCNFTVMPTTLDHDCSNSLEVSPSPLTSQSKVILRDAPVSQGQNKEAIYFPVLCTMSISCSLFPSSWPGPQFIRVAPEKFQLASLSCGWWSESLGQRMGWR